MYVKSLRFIFVLLMFLGLLNKLLNTVWECYVQSTIYIHLLCIMLLLYVLLIVAFILIYKI